MRRDRRCEPRSWTFGAVVLGQMADAFACRSATRWPGSLVRTSNRLLVVAELLVPVGSCSSFPWPRCRATPPPLWGRTVAALAVPAVFAAGVHRRIRACASGR